MDPHIEKETAELRPTLWQGVRSAWPYFTTPAPPQGGKVIGSGVDGLRYLAYIPDAAASQRLPVVYHLHGAGMFYSWLRRDMRWLAEQQERAVAAGTAQPMIIIAPYDETKFSMWADHADGSRRLAHQVTQTLPRHVEATYSVLTGRENTHIQGFSMGGFGAATLGLKHQDRYATISIFDGAMHDWSTMQEGHSGIASEQFLGDEAVFAEWSPWEWARRADLSRTPIFMAEGLMATYNRGYRDHLRANGASVTYVVTTCLHDLRGLQREVGQRVLAFMTHHGAPSP